MIVMGDIVVDERELSERFVRAIGPDGQNPRKKAAAVELRFDIDASSLPPDVKARLIAAAGRRVTKKHELVIVSRRFRSQPRNREAAHEQFVDLLRRPSSAVRYERNGSNAPVMREGAPAADVRDWNVVFHRSKE